MSRFNRFQPQGKIKILKTSGKGVDYVDWKDIENLRRMLSPNGKIYSRKRLYTNQREQTMIAQAIKRARFMGLWPYTSAPL